MPNNFNLLKAVLDEKLRSSLYSLEYAEDYESNRSKIIDNSVYSLIGDHK